ncbi:uncharacterized protein LOC125805072 [Astyanax mexicanus]|uniref:uncharacterized protein LOC125805072 n=1 Tax=Astyanax mexicanus TaxID=7994 RepID=UPI0020CB2EC0|nr:uncharacterized protein LOC125805072 [Astyanax mexicanus]
MHVSIRKGNSVPKYEQCGTCCQKYHCPLCSIQHYKPTSATKFRSHLKLHFNRAVQHEDSCDRHGRRFAHWAAEAMELGPYPTKSESKNRTEEMEPESGAREEVTTPLENKGVIRHIKAGVEWLKNSQHLLKDKCLTPQILSMEEEDARDALAHLEAHCTASVYEDDMDEDEIRAPFYFTFKSMKDMGLFLSEVRDKRKIMGSSFYNPDI